MAEDQDTEQEDVSGHTYSPKLPDDGEKDAKVVTGFVAAETEEDDVQGHTMTAKTPEEGRPDDLGKQA